MRDKLSSGFSVVLLEKKPSVVVSWMSLFPNLWPLSVYDSHTQTYEVDTRALVFDIICSYQFQLWSSFPQHLWMC